MRGSPSLASAPHTRLSGERVREGAGRRRRAPGPGPGGNRGPPSAARGVGAPAALLAGLGGGGRTPAHPTRPRPGRGLRPPPPPNVRRPPRRDGAEGESAVVPSVRAASLVLTPRAAAVAAARPSPWSAGPDPTAQLLPPPQSVSAPSRSICFCLVLPSNTGARERRLLAEARRPAGQSWRWSGS